MNGFAIANARALALVLALASTCIAPAGAKPRANAGQPQASVAPDRIVRGSVDRLTGFLLGSAEVSPETLGAFFQVEMAPLFDFDYMAERAAGGYWRRLDEAERQRLTEMLERLFLRALAHNLGTYRQPLPRFEVGPARLSRDGDTSVTALVLGERGRRTRLRFRFHRINVGWRAFDVAADDNSAIDYFRTYFARLLRRKGPAALVP